LEGNQDGTPARGVATGFPIRKDGDPLYLLGGTDRVEQVCYVLSEDEKTMGRVWINATQYFENVPVAAWKMHIGGYQICLKWLKDRKGRILSGEEIAQYQKIVAILAETIALMEAIDGVIEQAGWPLL
jgi:hypothetical protein